MADQRRAGFIHVKADGVVLEAKGDFSYDIGGVKREAIIGADGTIHGFKETAVPSYIEGAITDRSDLDTNALFNGTNLTVTLELANGKTISQRGAWYAGDRTVTTSESEIKVRWEGPPAQEII